MSAHPAQLLALYLLGLAASAVGLVALYLLWRLSKPRRMKLHEDDRPAVVQASPAPPEVPVRRKRHALALLVPLLMLLWVFLGKFLLMPFYPGATAPRAELPAGRSATVQGTSGAQLAVTNYGPAEGPTLLLTHGWGADQHEWTWLMRALPQSTRVVTWDLPGLGRSSRPRGEYTMAAMASDLDSVVSSVKGGPVILVGHSVGGMLNLEYARLHPEKLGRQVSGVVQANTTYTNPIETKKNADRSRKLQDPVFKPLLHVVASASPVFRAMGWLAYQSGLAHLQLARQSFAGGQTWDQLDEMARYAYRSSPRVLAEGVLAMMKWDGTDVLRQIKVPTLIISGEQDVTTLPAASDRMEKDIPSAQRVRVDPAAHMGPVEQDRRYAEAVVAFAGSVGIAK
ncbi:MAG: alpha/beta hydrolase [Pseudomonadota bacterium]